MSCGAMRRFDGVKGIADHQFRQQLTQGRGKVEQIEPTDAAVDRKDGADLIDGGCMASTYRLTEVS